MSCCLGQCRVLEKVFLPPTCALGSVRLSAACHRAWLRMWLEHVPVLVGKGSQSSLQAPSLSETPSTVLCSRCRVGRGCYFLCQNQPPHPDLIIAAVESTALSESSAGSQDNPWNRLPPISLTLESSEGESPCPRASSLPHHQEAVIES